MEALKSRWPGRAIRRVASLSTCLLALFLMAAGNDPQSDDAPNPPDQAGRPEAPPSAHLIRVPLPITGEVDTRIKRTIDRLLDDLPAEGTRPVLVLEFAASQARDEAASDFERSLSLARYLAGNRLGRVKTVAYVPGSLRGHAVLAAIACEELILNPDAEFGEAGVKDDFVDGTMRSAYGEIASRRRTIPEPVALAMLDPKLTIYRVVTLDGVSYVLEDELERLKKDAAVRSVDTVVAAGDLARFTGREMRLKYGFASQLAADRQQLESVLRLPAGSISEDPSLEEKWHAVRIDLKGRVTGATVNHVLKAVDDGRRQQANFICLWIDSPGGSPADSVRLANTLSQFEPGDVRTVAYVGGQARGDAAIVALACDQLLMEQNAFLGGPGDHHLTASDVEDLRVPLQQLARAKGRDWSLPQGLLDRDLHVYRYRREGTGEERYFCEEELNGQDDPGQWRRGEELDLARGLLARECESLGLAEAVVRDYDELAQIYNLEEAPTTIEPAWAETALQRLAAQPWFARTLLFIGFFALISEASAPGVGAPGFIAILCFLLFFWAQFLNGSSGWLEVLLFLGGVTCVAIEVFALPGLGIFGIGGGVMVIASIVLASQTFVIPRNSYQLDQLPGSLFTVVVAGAGAFAALFVMRRYLPDAPVFKRIMLAPPEGEELVQLAARESFVSWVHLHGKRGDTTTRLSPSGKARFGDDVVDVISDGELIPAGTPVRVVEVEGNRVVVTPVDESG